MRILGFFLCGLVGLLVWSSALWALPEIEVEQINGFEVHFVNVGRGNSFGLSFQVPFGTLNDFGRFLGRAHLLEHVMHIGSLRHPGYESFNRTLQSAGVQSNAYTFWNRTFYYGGAREDQAELMMSVFFGMLGGLEWDTKNLTKERAVVTNEVFSEGMKSEGKAFMQMPMALLLPDGHPWKHPMLGDKRSLQYLRIKDLKNLYNQIYTPSNVKVALHGNFSNPEFKKKIRDLVTKYLHASPEQNGAPLSLSARQAKSPAYQLLSRETVSMFDSAGIENSPSSQRLYLKSENSHSGGILLEADPPEDLNSQAIDSLVNYMALQIPGSLSHKLKVELGWVTKVSFYSVSVGNKRLLSFEYDLSDKGKGHNQEINALFFQALKSAQDHDADQTYLDTARKLTLHDLSASGRTVANFLQTYGQILNEKKNLPELLWDLETVGPKDLRRAAKLFTPEKALYVNMGTEEIGKMDFEPRFHRAFKIEDNRADLTLYQKIMSEPAQASFTPKLDKIVDLGPMPTPSPTYYLQSTDAAAPSERFVFDVRDDMDEAAITYTFKFKPNGPEDLVALDLIMAAFDERYMSELLYIRQNYFVSFGSGRTSTELMQTASGDDSYVARALAWRLQKMTEFVPTQAELDRAIEKYAEERSGNYHATFSGVLGLTETRTLLDPLDLGAIGLKNAAKDMTLDKASAAWTNIRQRSDHTFVAAGALNFADLEGVRKAGTAFSRSPLRPGEEEMINKRIRWSSETQEFLAPFPENKGVDTYALGRIFRGPKVDDLKEVAAFTALNGYLTNRIYEYNRGQQKLGYIHHSTIRAYPDDHMYLFMFGGTEGEENATRTKNGWKLVIDELRDGKVSDQQLAGVIQAQINGLSRQKTAARELVADYIGGFMARQTPQASAEALAAMQSITVQDVRDVAQKYVVRTGTAYTQLTLHGCADLLAP